MKEKLFYFGYRTEKKLYKRIKAYLFRQKISLSAFAIEAFDYASQTHNKRKINFSSASVFKGRIKKNDKIETHFTQTEKQREAVRSFAFSYRLSMAEVFRISMEAYLDFLKFGNSKSKTIKHVYRTQVTINEMTLAIIYPAFHVIYPIDFHLKPD